MQQPFLRKFILRTLFLLTPFFLYVVLYFVCDPFKVLRSYASFYDNAAPAWVNLNADYVSTTNYDLRYPTVHYDAFIFGNSRSRYYRVADWRQFLTAGVHPYHFDAHNESLYGLVRKAEYIDSLGRPLRFALIVLDRDLLPQTSSEPSRLKHISPQLENNALTARIGFHIATIKDWFQLRFARAYLEARLRHRLLPYMEEQQLLLRPASYDPQTNEETYPLLEKQISVGTYFTPAMLQRFEGRQQPDSTSRATIHNAQLRLLRRLQTVFRKHQTDYRIIISPLYDQVRLHPRDVALLRSIFGADKVFDFSGVNDITTDMHNYYEPAHYRPTAALRLMHRVYGTHLSSQQK